MAEEHKEVKSHDQIVDEAVETHDRALFGLIGKKDEEDKSHEVTEPELATKVQVSGYEETKPGVLEKLHPSKSGSGSSSEDEDGENKKEKKGIEEKLKEKIRGGGGGDEQETVISSVVNSREEEEHKGFVDKIKDKFAEKDEEPELLIHPPTRIVSPTEQPEKDGIIEKMKEKIYGNGEDDKTEKKCSI